MSDTRHWPQITVESRHGIPTLHRDGRPWFGWGTERPIFGDHCEIFATLASQGLRQFHVDATCSEDIYHPELRFWHGPGTFNPDFQHRYFQRLAAICPEALFQLRLYVGAPPWWVESHPDHCQTYHDGSIHRELQRAGKPALPSLASPLWRQEICTAMRRYVEWLIDSGWSRRVSALFLGYGITWEWGLLGSDGFLDYNPHAQQYFRQWLRNKYGSADRLAAAWGRPADFDTAAIPSPQERSRPGGPNGLRSIPSEQAVIDHQQSLSDMNVDVLLAVAQTVKSASANQALVGAFYGYTLTAREQNPFTGLYGAGGFVGGHHALGRVLRSPAVDFLASPFSYANRDLGTGLLQEHVPLASVFAHGKAFFDENDLYPHTNQPKQDDRATSISVGIARTARESILYLRLAFMQAMVRGKHQWLTELTGWVGHFQENFTDPDLLREIARLNALAEALVSSDRRSISEVAMILDEQSIAHLTRDHTAFRDYVYMGSVQWGHAAAPCDVLLLEDLLETPADRYKLVIPACVKSPEALATFKGWIQQSRARVWWNHSRDWYPPADAAALIAVMTESRVHRYLTEPATAWANASMVGLHVGHPGKRTVHFRGPAKGVELFSQTPIVAQNGTLDWDFSENDVVLFLLQPA